MTGGTIYGNLVVYGNFFMGGGELNGDITCYGEIVLDYGVLNGNVKNYGTSCLIGNGDVFEINGNVEAYAETTIEWLSVINGNVYAETKINCTDVSVVKGTFILNGTNAVLSYSDGKVTHLELRNKQIGDKVLSFDKNRADLDFGELMANVIGLPEGSKLAVEDDEMFIRKVGIAVNVYVDGENKGAFDLDPTKNLESQVSSLPLSDEQSCGYFLDEMLTKDPYHYETVQEIADTAGLTNLYTRTATINLLDSTQLNNGIIKARYKTIIGIVVVPRKYNGKYTSLLEIELSTNGAGAFAGCNSISAVYLPSSITKINNCTFTGMTTTTFKTINLCDTLISIGDSAFAESYITNVKLPDSLTSIGAYAFKNCTNIIGEMILPSQVKNIGNYAFQNCSKISKVLMPTELELLGEYAFDGCKGLVGELSIPAGAIGKFAFNNCTGITKLVVGNGVTEIGESAFTRCSNLEGNVNISESVGKIGNSAFRYCTKISSVTLLSGVVSIGTAVFGGCTSLKSIYIPATVTTIYAGSASSSPFNGCSSTLTVYLENSTQSTKWGKYWNYYSSTGTLAVRGGYTREQYEAEVGIS